MPEILALILLFLLILRASFLFNTFAVIIYPLLLRCLTGFADDALFYVFNAFTLIRFRRSIRPDLSRDLTDHLLIVAFNSDDVFLYADFNAFWHFVIYRVRKS